jgi:hypothetical protein
VLVATASRCLSVARKARNYENARRLLGRIELENPLAGKEIEEETDSGTFPSPYSNYKWRREIAMEGEEEDGLFRITMSVSWSARGKDIAETVVTYLQVPEDQRGGSFESR